MVPQVNAPLSDEKYEHRLYHKLYLDLNDSTLRLSTKIANEI